MDFIQILPETGENPTGFSTGFHRIDINFIVAVKKIGWKLNPIILYRRKCCKYLDKKIFSWYAIDTEQIPHQRHSGAFVAGLHIYSVKREKALRKQASRFQKEVIVMYETIIQLNAINDVKDFVNTVMQFDYDIDLISGRYAIDAKSIMGIFSLDLSKPMMDLASIT